MMPDYSTQHVARSMEAMAERLLRWAEDVRTTAGEAPTADQAALLVERLHEARAWQDWLEFHRKPAHGDKWWRRWCETLQDLRELAEMVENNRQAQKAMAGPGPRAFQVVVNVRECFGYDWGIFAAMDPDREWYEPNRAMAIGVAATMATRLQRLAGMVRELTSADGPRNEAENRQHGEPSDRTLPTYVTMDQAAALVQRSKRCLRHYYDDNEMPPPDIRGGGGKPHQWRYETLRLWLTETFDYKLPLQMPRLL